MSAVPRAQLLATHPPGGHLATGGEGGGDGEGGERVPEVPEGARQAWRQCDAQHEEVQEHGACGFLLVRYHSTILYCTVKCTVYCH